MRFFELQGKRSPSLRFGRGRVPGTRRKFFCRLRLEWLEDRTLPSTFTVANTNDSGLGSLRQAITDANATAGLNTIDFNIPTSDPGYNSTTHSFTIIPTSPGLPAITSSVTIDGTSQPGFVGTPIIELDGASAGAGVSGLNVVVANCTIEGLVINRFYDGILLNGAAASNEIIQGNYIGTDPTGAIGEGNVYDGILVQGGSNNLVGGTAPGSANVVSGNAVDGIDLLGGAANNTIEGNFVGTDVSGTKAVPNGTANDAGIYINNSTNNTIGGTTASARNIVSGNGAFGIATGNVNVSGNVIEGNYVGVDVTGAHALGNARSGISVEGSNNTIGGTAAGGGNVASANGDNGIYLLLGASNNLVEGNFVGTDASGSVAIPNNYGIFMEEGASSNTIGGVSAGARNIVSGNLHSGVNMNPGTNQNVVIGNYIGTDVTGTRAIGNGFDGVIVFGASNNTIGGTAVGAGNVISGNSANGVDVQSGSTGNLVEGNLVGTDATGTASIPNGAANNGYAGLYIFISSNNTVGGTTAAARNIISGNGGASLPLAYGVEINGNTATANVLEGNYVGTDVTGTHALGNGGTGGVLVFGGANDNTIGGTVPGAGNFISGNGGLGTGVAFSGSGTSGNVLQGNDIGTDVTGTRPLPNLSVGVAIVSGASNNTIGGTTPGAGNVIAFNGDEGILIGSAPTVGITIPAGTGNAVLGNSIYSNAAIGIDLGPHDGVTPNDSAGHSGPNNFQNFPVLTSVTTAGGAATIQGTLNSAANTTFRVEFFANAAGDPTGYGQGQTFLGFASVTTDGTGQAAFTASFTLPAGQRVVTATATDPAGNTSEFDQWNATSTAVTSSANPSLFGQVITLTATVSAIEPGAGTPTGTVDFKDGNTDLTPGGVSLSGQAATFTTASLSVGSYTITATYSGDTTFAGSSSTLVQTVNKTNLFIVTTTADSGPGSLRQAILNSNATAGLNTITFDIPATDPGHFYYKDDGVAGQVSLANITPTTAANDSMITDIDPDYPHSWWVITPPSDLPGITNPVVIDAYTQPGANTNTLAMGDNAVLRIEISGAALLSANPSNDDSGLQLLGNGNTVEGLVMNGGFGADVGNRTGDQPGSGNLVQGNFLGTDVSGTLTVAVHGFGVRFIGASNTIGGSIPAARNIISGNNVGLTFEGADSNLVAGNYIGTNRTGTVAIPNAIYGVQITASNCTVGGATMDARNVISGNGDAGIALLSGAAGNLVEGNFVGTDATGTQALGNDITNGAGSGIFIDSSNNTIGGTTAAARNIVSGNSFGIGTLNGNANVTGNLIEGNYVGVDVTGAHALGNAHTGINVFGSNNTIGGDAAGAGNVASGNGDAGIALLSGASSNLVEGNFVGTDATGTQALGNDITNGGGSGIFIDSSNNTIGGTTAAARNIVSGNSFGIGTLNGNANVTGNLIEGNYVGVDVTGAHALGNVHVGINVFGSNNTIGGTAPGAGNVASANGGDGIALLPGASSNLVEGNFVGTDATGTKALPNGTGTLAGIDIDNSTNNTIGGTTAAARNIVSGNGFGIGEFGGQANDNLIEGNYVGLDVTGSRLLGNVHSGISLEGSNNTVSSNVVSGNGDAGIVMFFASSFGNLVVGNFVGTDATGTVALGGNFNNGIELDGAPDNTIGGTTAAARNIVSGNAGNGIGLFLGSSNNLIDGNFIGTDVTGTVSLGNNGLSGVLVASGANDNTIGGTLPGAGNLISGNAGLGTGVGFSDSGTSGNVVQGNDIGTDVTGSRALPNLTVGVAIVAGASNNTIGGTTPGAGNVIAFNGDEGTLIGSAPTVGITTPAGTGNAVLGNAIFSNTGIGIDLGPHDGVTPNDSAGHSGPNNFQNFPVLTSVTTAGGVATIQGTLNSAENTTFRLEFFANAAGDPSGYGEGQTYLGFASVTTDGTGQAAFTASFALPAGQPVVTATATDPAGNTSEFCQWNATSTVLKSSANPSVFGQVVTFTATVSAIEPGAGTPTGTVDFKDGSTDLTPGGVSLSGQVATFTTASFSVGSHTITATYSGGTDFASSVSSSLVQMVSPDATSVVIAASPASVVTGQAVSFTATVSNTDATGQTPTGTIQFTIDGSNFGSPVTLSGLGNTATAVSGSTTFTASSGARTITAHYVNADGNFTPGADASETLAAAKAGTNTMDLSAPNPSVFGQVVTFTATVSATAPGAGTPTGIVDFTNGNTDLTPGGVSLSGQVATFTTASLSVGSDTITATYSGDTDFAGSVSSTLVQMVSPDATSVVIAASPASVVTGQAVSFTVTVSNTDATGQTPTGTIQFTIDGSNFGSPVTLGGSGNTATAVSGSTTFTASSGAHTITAHYVNADGDFTPGADASTSLTAAKAGTTTTELSAPNPSVFGQVVTFTATVSAAGPGAGTPTGTVDFKEGNADLTPGGVSLAGQVATFSTTSLAVGSDTITATYSGDADFAGSVSSTLVQVVGPDATSVVIAASPASVVTGQAVSFTAAVSNTDATGQTPTGTIQFTIDGSNFGSPVTLSGSGNTATAVSGSTTFTASSGTHTITAHYVNADVNFAPGADASETLAAAKAGTNTVDLSAPNPSVFGQVVTFTATVSVAAPGAGTPTGIVDFTNGNTDLTPGGVSLSGQVATFTTASLSLGSDTITATYRGDTDFAGSVSSTLVQVVNKAGTTTTITASVASSPFGQHLTFTAAVSAMPPGAGIPTGTVDFFDVTTGIDLGLATLSSGHATLTVSTLAVGSHSITATYSGDGNFLASTGSTATITVLGSAYVLDPTASGALTLSGNAILKEPGVIVVDSNSPVALTANGNAQAIAGSIQVVGGFRTNGLAALTPTPVTGVAPAADPLAALPVPTGGIPQGSVNLSQGSLTINPGIYSQINVSGKASLTLNPGVYVIAGGGFTVSGQANVNGNGVMIYNAGSNYPGKGGSFGSLTLSGQGAVNLAPAASGTYAGILIFQSRDNPRAVNLIGQSLALNGGVVYAADAQLTLSGNGQLTATAVVDTLNGSGNMTFNAALGDPGLAYTPAQIRSAYGVNNLALDGTGQTIAIVDAYDDPAIYQAVDTFDAQFGLTASGPRLYDQYGPASSFVSVVNESGQVAPLPATDPTGAGASNWETETSLDVEWAHALAPGARIVLVEANSQSLADLMTSIATAASQPGVSVVSMSWGFPEGTSVLRQDEATYDSYFNVPGVTFVASTGDYGTADPEYPAFSPNVVAVGGTTLNVNGDGSYSNETGWGSSSSAVGAFIGSGGGLSQFEPEPVYQQGVQSTGSRSTPDVSFVADPATGAWIADPYNLDPSQPFEVIGGTSLSAPSWAGLLALVDQGRANAGQPALNRADPTETQQDLYGLSQSDYHVIASGTNGGYNAAPGYNLVTGLGTPVADRLVPDLVAGNFPASGQVAPMSPNQGSGVGGQGSGGGSFNAMSVFDVETALSASTLEDGRPSVGGFGGVGDPRHVLSFDGDPRQALASVGGSMTFEAGGDYSATSLPAKADGWAVNTKSAGTTLQAESASDLLFAGDYLMPPEQDSAPDRSFGESLMAPDWLDRYGEALQAVLDDWA
jgi:Bacterial Ig-like domain (group 3)